MPPVQTRPAIHGLAPQVRDFRKHVDPRADVFAALGVVRGGADQRPRPGGLPCEIVAMELLDRGGAASGIAAHLVQRRQGEVAVEGRVLDPLGHHGAGDLLEAAHEQLPLAAAGLVQIGRAFQQQHVANEVEHGGVGGRVAALRLRRRAADDLPVALGNVALANVRAVDGKAGQDFAQRDPQRVEREIARAPVPLGNAIEPVGEQLQVARHGRAEDQQLRLVGHLAEIEPLVDEAAVDIGQFGQPGRIDEQPVDGVQEIVARRAGQQPLFGQGLLGAEDLFHHHVERKRARGRCRSLPSRFGRNTGSTSFHGGGVPAASGVGGRAARPRRRCSGLRRSLVERPCPGPAGSPLAIAADTPSDRTARRCDRSAARPRRRGPAARTPSGDFPRRPRGPPCRRPPTR